jgi:hypothetical protein
MNQRQIAWSVAVLVWVNALPYLSRLPRGMNWVAQYLPDEGFTLVGLVFFHTLYSAPAIPLIGYLRKSEKPGLSWVLALLAVTALTWLFNKDYDLAADAQAATGLVIFPLCAMGAAYGILALGRRFGKNAGRTENSAENALETALSQARQSPGWLGRKNH